MQEKDKRYIELEEIVDSFKRVSQFSILIFENHHLDSKHQILRNFTAKTHSLLNSIAILLSNNQEGEAMALYRLLIERYLYLEYLEQTNKYQEFKDWSYIKTFESRNKARSNSKFNDKEIQKNLKDGPEQTKKYQKLKREKIDWKEPNLDKLAKELNISVLYSLGYDLGSSFIHPRADEGYWDAIRIASKDDLPIFRRRNILTNAILVANSILMLAANNSSINFGKLLNLYCNSIFDFINRAKELPNLKDIEKIFYAEILAKSEPNQ